MSDENPPRNAREAAEALFKPKQPSPAAEDPTVQSDGSAPPEPAPPPPRAPRILMVPQPQPAPAPEPPPERKRRSRRVAVEKGSDGAIPRSEHGRIRVLTTYGMTIRQVADAYGVAESEVERIITKPAPEQ